MTEQILSKHITPEQLYRLDLSAINILDIRDPKEISAGGFDGSINIPFSNIFKRLDDIPSDKPVLVICRGGIVSKQIADILADRGYDASTLDKGYNGYRDYLDELAMEESGS